MQFTIHITGREYALAQAVCQCGVASGANQSLAEWSLANADWNTAQLDSSGVALTDAMKQMEGLSSTPPPSRQVDLCYG